MYIGLKWFKIPYTETFSLRESFKNREKTLRLYIFVNSCFITQFSFIFFSSNPKLFFVKSLFFKPYRMFKDFELYNTKSILFKFLLSPYSKFQQSYPSTKRPPLPSPIPLLSNIFTMDQLYVYNVCM